MLQVGDVLAMTFSEYANLITVLAMMGKGEVRRRRYHIRARVQQSRIRAMCIELCSPQSSSSITTVVCVSAPASDLSCAARLPVLPQAQRFVFGMMDDTRSGVVHISAFLNVMQKLQVGRHTNTTTI